jgi:hypothetical protein
MKREHINAVIVGIGLFLIAGGVLFATYIPPRGGATAIVANAPLLGDGSSLNHLRIPKATASVDGYLDHTDYSGMWVKRAGDTMTGTLVLQNSLTTNSTTAVTNLNADLLDGQHGAYYQSANNINAGTLGLSYYSAYADLAAEGELDNNSDTDLLIRSQGDARWVNTAGDTLSGQLFGNLTGTVTGHSSLDLPLAGGTMTGQLVWPASFTTIAPLSCDSEVEMPHWNAGLLDGQHGSYYRSASNINAGTLGLSYYSAYADLAAEGELDNNSDTDLLIRSQGDARWVNTAGDTLSGQLFGNLTGTVTGHSSLDLALDGGSQTVVDYLIADGGFTVNLAFLTSTQIMSSLASGTSPLSVASTTVNANLNADMVDGEHGSSYALLSGPTFTGAVTMAGTTAGAKNITMDGGTLSASTINLYSPFYGSTEYTQIGATADSTFSVTDTWVGGTNRQYVIDLGYNHRWGEYSGNQIAGGAMNYCMGTLACSSTLPLSSYANAVTTGNANIMIGSGACPGTPTQLTGAIGLGMNAAPMADYTMAIGGAAGTADAVKVGIGTGDPQATLDVVGDIQASDALIMGGCITQPYYNSSSTLHKGELVYPDDATDFSVILADTPSGDQQQVVGVVSDTTCARGAVCMICVYGMAQVLLENSTACNRGYYCTLYPAGTAGRADCEDDNTWGGMSFGNTRVYVGRAAQHLDAGTDVLCTINLRSALYK